MLIFLLASVSYVLIPPYFALSADDWTTTLKSQFDIVETFDKLQDWVGTGTSDVSSPSDMPKNEDGSQSQWGFYSHYGTNPISHNWIDSFGPDRVWRETGKSLCIDMSSQSNGPSRLGLYFGDGTPNSGYQEIYLFHMVKITKNQYPTAIAADLTGSYIEGNPYVYFDSWKFGTFNMGCTKPICSNSFSTANYSDFHIIPHIKTSAYINNFQPSIKLEPNDLGLRGGVWGKGKEVILDEWMGVEFHIKNVQESGVNYAYMDVWIYDKTGNEWQVIKAERVSFASQPITDRWNNFMFGGNNSNTYKWGQSMTAPYYVDDLIIDDNRIGPKYFLLLSQSPIIESIRIK